MSQLEDTLAFQLKAAKLDTGMVRELVFHPKRKWRFDFAFPTRKLAIECEGGLFSSGRHVRSAGATEDMVKYNEAQLMSWTVLRFSAAHIKSGEALRMIERALG